VLASNLGDVLFVPPASSGQDSPAEPGRRGEEDQEEDGPDFQVIPGFQVIPEFHRQTPSNADEVPCMDLPGLSAPKEGVTFNA
jgi:hypothetical protein